MILLQTKEDMAIVVYNWQQDLLMILEDLQDKNASDIDIYNAYKTCKELIQNLPFSCEYTINEEVMSRFTDHD